MLQVLQKFMKNKIDINHIYNEFSLQFELGYFLRDNGYNVFFEKNVKDYGFNKEKPYKSEIDLVAEKDDKRYAIELKYPKNGQYPEEMYQFIRDIAFAQQLVSNSANGKRVFEKTYCLTLVDDEKFYSDMSTKSRKLLSGSIYSHFRHSQNKVPYTLKQGTYNKPTGKASATVSCTTLQDVSYTWNNVNGTNFWYYIVENQ